MKSRAQFEAWAASCELDATRWNGGYADEATQTAWVAWQTATERAAVLVSNQTQRKRLIAGIVNGAAVVAECEYAEAIREGNE